MFEQAQHEACRTCNQRRERREEEFASLFRMIDCALVRFRVDEVAPHVYLVFFLAAVHLRINSIACSVGEHLEKPIKYFILRPGAFSFLDNRAEKVLAFGINLNLSAQLDLGQTLLYSNRLDTKCIDN